MARKKPKMLRGPRAHRLSVNMVKSIKALGAAVREAVGTDTNAQLYVEAAVDIGTRALKKLGKEMKKLDAD